MRRILLVLAGVIAAAALSARVALSLSADPDQGLMPHLPMDASR